MDGLDQGAGFHFLFHSVVAFLCWKEAIWMWLHAESVSFGALIDVAMPIKSRDVVPKAILGAAPLR